MAAVLPGGPIRRGGWTLELEAPAPGLLLTRASGHADTEMVILIAEGFAQVEGACQRKVDVFHDWAGLTGYTVDARSFLVSSSARQARHIGEIHILHSDRLAEALSVANLTLGGTITGHTDRAAFEAALAARIGAAAVKRG